MLAGLAGATEVLIAQGDAIVETIRDIQEAYLKAPDMGKGWAGQSFN